MDVPLDRILGDALGDAGPRLRDRVLERLVERLPVYGAMPVEQLGGDVRRIVDLMLRGFADALAQGGQPPAELLEAARESAIQRGEEGIPVEAILDAYILGIDVAVEHLQPLMLERSPAELVDLMRWTLQFQESVGSAVARGYVEQREAAVGEVHAARSAVLAAVVDGSAPEEVARRAGIVLAERYRVLSIELGKHPDETAEAVGPTIAARRKARRVRVALERADPDGVLASVSPRGGLALLAAPGPDLGWLRAELQRAAGATVTLAVEDADVADVPDMARLTSDVLEVVRLTERPPGVYRLADVMLDFQLTRPSEALDRMVERLEAVGSKPVLVDTLWSFLGHRQRRRATATALGVHPNTVDNRLRRVRDLTGFDANDPSQAAALRAALAVWRRRDSS